MLYEAAALGVNMSVPYGAWMGARIEDAVWAPHEETIAIQSFLADHDHLYSTESTNDVAVLTSPRAMLVAQALDGARQAKIDPVTGRRRQDSTRGVELFTVLEAIAGDGHPIDVIPLHDDRLRTDDLDPEALRRYRRLVLVECAGLTDHQLAAVLGRLDAGVPITVVGSLAGGDSDLVDRILGHDLTTAAVASDQPHSMVPERQLDVGGVTSVAGQLHAIATGVALHLVSYDYDLSADRSVEHVATAVKVRLPFSPRSAMVHRPGSAPERLDLAVDDDVATMTLPAWSGYALVAFER